MTPRPYRPIDPGTTERIERPRPAHDDTPVDETQVLIRSVFDVAVCEDGSLRVAQRDTDGYLHDLLITFATAKAECDFAKAVLDGVTCREEHDLSNRFAGVKPDTGFDLLGDTTALGNFVRESR